MPRRYDGLFARIATFPALIAAARRAARGKRRSRGAAAFLANLETNCRALEQSLQRRTWRPGRYTVMRVPAIAPWILVKMPRSEEGCDVSLRTRCERHTWGNTMARKARAAGRILASRCISVSIAALLTAGAQAGDALNQRIDGGWSGGDRELRCSGGDRDYRFTIEGGRATVTVDGAEQAPREIYYGPDGFVLSSGGARTGSVYFVDFVERIGEREFYGGARGLAQRLELGQCALVR